MGFPKDIMQQALEMKTEQREVALLRAEKAKEKLYKENAALAELDRALAASGAMAATVALSGDKKLIKELAEKTAALNSKRKAILAEAGGIEPQFACKKCKDTGRVDGITCSCVKDIARELMFAKLCAKMPLKECTFENFDLSYYATKDENGLNPKARMKEIFALCKKYAADFSLSSESLLFLGGVGLGKTHLSLAIANQAIKKGYGVVYGPAPALISAAERERFDYEDNGAMESLLTCDLLIIDDLGTEFSTQFSLAVINEVVNSRLQENLPTIINTNLDLRALADKYTPRVSSRLIGCYTMRQFLGEDIRLLKKAGN